MRFREGKASTGKVILVFLGLVFLAAMAGVAFGVMDYNSIEFGGTPKFMMRQNSGGDKQEWMGLGYRYSLEKKCWMVEVEQELERPSDVKSSGESAKVDDVVEAEPLMKEVCEDKRSFGILWFDMKEVNK